MMFQSSDQNRADETAPESPFLIHIEHLDRNERGYWRPAAHVRFAAALRTSGLLGTLQPEDFKSLLWLLSFVTPNGDCSPSLLQLASAMRVSQGKAKSRLEHLAQARWQGKPIVLHTRSGDGLERFGLSPGFIPVQEDADMPQQASSSPLRVASREAVIEHSRRTYARPRAEVERQIAELNGWKLPQESVSPPATASPLAVPESSQAALRNDLLRVGLLPEQADELLAGFDALRIRRQLAWLPYRTVRNRAGFLIAAIKDDYAAPRRLP